MHMYFDVVVGLLLRIKIPYDRKPEYPEKNNNFRQSLE
jgi:hypothetical protein